MQLSQCLGAQYSLPCTEWLRGLPFGLLGRGLFFFFCFFLSLSLKISCPLIFKKKIDSNWEVNK